MSEQSVREIMAATFSVPVESLGENPSTSTIPSWNSLRHMHLVVAMEERFDVEFPVETVPTLTSLSSISDALAALGVS